jgi:hypothetical protein
MVFIPLKFLKECIISIYCIYDICLPWIFKSGMIAAKIPLEQSYELIDLKLTNSI